MKKKILISAAAVLLYVLLRGFRWACVIPAAYAALFLLLDFLEKKKTERQIRALTDYVTRVQDVSALPEMAETSEGSLGILQSEIYKVITLLKEEYSAESRQKKYMSDMMSDISHQFKTPLTAISLMTELLTAPEMSAEKRIEYAAKIETQAEKMTWLIRSLLTLSQLEAGVLAMDCAPLSLEAIAEEMREPLGIMAEAAEVELDFRIPAGTGTVGDGHWLREALTNIVKNAIEHTPPGGAVHVRASEDNLFLRIFVEDTGCGIAAEHLPHIFERFYKAGGSSPDSVGIGLALSRQIVRNHGGDITVRSEEGKGTVFEITLPADGSGLREEQAERQKDREESES